jgi:RsiW-degrading membrane proteinase PrsW (M82 family)
MKFWKNLTRQDAAMIWGFGLFCGGAEAVRDGITLPSVISFAGALMLGFMAWAVFMAAGLCFEHEPPKKQWVYQLAFLLVVTYLASGAPWR